MTNQTQIIFIVNKSHIALRHHSPSLFTFIYYLVSMSRLRLNRAIAQIAWTVDTVSLHRPQEPMEKKKTPIGRELTLNEEKESTAAPEWLE